MFGWTLMGAPVSTRSLISAVEGCKFEKYYKHALAVFGFSSNYTVPQPYRSQCYEQKTGKGAFSTSGSPEGKAPLAFLNSLTNYEKIGIDSLPSQSMLTPNRTKTLLDLLGNPQKKLKVIHVAGSKGKGSVSSMLGAILHASGFKVGLYSSPHVQAVNERLHLTGGVGPPVSTEQLEEYIQRARPAVEKMIAEGIPPSFFEALTAIALSKFADMSADIVVIETGMGGAGDATNVFESDNLCAAVITPIEMEHAQQLGGTLEKIALSKAGIMKHNCPVVSGYQCHDLVEVVLKREADKLDCPLVAASDKSMSILSLHEELHPSKPFQLVHMSLKGLEHEGGEWKERIKLGLLVSRLVISIPSSMLPVAAPHQGEHQVQNAETAIRTVSVLCQRGWNVSKDSILQGLALADLPGRLQVMKPSSDSPWLVLDGAHTKASASMMANTVMRLFPHGTPVAVVVAMMKDKEHPDVLQEILRMEPMSVIFTKASSFGDQRSISPGTLVALWDMLEMKICESGKSPVRCRKLIQASVTASLHKAISEVKGHGNNGVVVVTGSMYAVSDALLAIEKHLQL